MEYNNLISLIAAIKRAVNNGEKSICVYANAITEEEVEKIRQETGIENVKNVTPYFDCNMSLTSKEKEDYEKFIKTAFDVNRQAHYDCYGKLMEKEPKKLPSSVVVIYIPNWCSRVNRTDIRRQDLGILPSLVYQKELITFKEAIQRPSSDFYDPSFKLNDIKLMELYSDSEEVCRKDMGNGILRLFRSRGNPYMYYYFEEQKYDSCDHKKGYPWATRASVINATFNVKVMEVTVYDGPSSAHSCAMSVDKARELIPSAYELVEVEDQGEVVYKMRKNDRREINDRILHLQITRAR